MKNTAHLFVFFTYFSYIWRALSSLWATGRQIVLTHSYLNANTIMEDLKKTINPLTDEIVKDVIEECGFHICRTITEDKRAQACKSYDDLQLSKLSTDYLEGREIPALWKHQHLAVKKAKEGNNVCVTTSTSSGKSEIFILSALEVLAKNPQARILAVYPMKALNRQQVDRWQEAYTSVGKIDGDTSWTERERILQNKSVVVMTPDVIHAWLLDNINDSRYGDIVKKFISNISLVVIDELHLYKGLFGTNSAYLFRRLNNVRRLLRGTNDLPQYITASATLPNACEHSFNITGASNFVEIGRKEDGSPMAKKTFFFIEEVEPNATIGELVKSFAAIDGTKSITFVESRQKTGVLVNTLANNNIIKGIFAYRSGYEVTSANIIAEALNRGEFRGVFSTSALEIGIDIDGLNICIIADMPHDKNSYQQRIGRVGRGKCDNSYVIVVKNNRSLPSKLLFEEFDCDINKVLPNYEPALYLDAPNIQNVQALIHVGDHDFSEYAQWKRPACQNQEFDGKALFPRSFGDLCDKILNGQTSVEYENLARTCANPQRAYTLRHFGKQFTLEAIKEDEAILPTDEQICREQIATEGYPQAIRSTYRNGNLIRERIVRVQNSEHKITVKNCTSPILKTESYHRGYVIPNFERGHRYGTMEFGECVAFNLMLQEHQSVYGYYETTRWSRTYYPYAKDGLPSPYYLPTLKTTGTVIFHPAFNEIGVNVGDIADILFETFLRLNAFDRNDISHKGGRLYSDFENECLHAGYKFVALYDTNELNITKKLLDEQLLKELMNYIKSHMNIVISTLCPNISNETRDALVALCDTVLTNKAVAESISVGQQKKIKLGSKVIYHMPQIEGQDEETAVGLFVGNGDFEGTCNLMFGQDKFLRNIPFDCIETTSETVFETIRYE